MQRDYEKRFTVIEIDHVTGDHIIRIPGSMITELGWYEDTEVSMIMEGNEIVIGERNE
jgi:antitoxin component of MazEF toxin-antitoxin module